jgi:hypothetical protein
MGHKNYTNTGFQEKLLQKISKRERIQITSGKHQYISFSLILFYVVIVLSTISFYLYRNGLTWKLLFIAACMMILFYPLFLVCRKMADIAVKGDILLINQIFSPCKVTSIKSVRAVRTRSFFHLSITSLTYILDGSKGKVILFERLKSKGSKPEEIIKFIRNAA